MKIETIKVKPKERQYDFLEFFTRDWRIFFRVNFYFSIITAFIIVTGGEIFGQDALDSAEDDSEVKDSLKKKGNFIRPSFLTTRDPFFQIIKSSNDHPTVTNDYNETNLDKIPLKELKLIGIASSSDGKQVAMLENRQGKGFIIKIGQVFAKERAFLKLIRNKSIQIEYPKKGLEENSKYSSKNFVQDTEIIELNLNGIK